MFLTLNLLVLTLIGGSLGVALLMRPEWVASSSRNQYWMRTPVRRGLFQYAGGLGFLFLGSLALLDLLFESISIFPGD